MTLLTIGAILFLAFEVYILLQSRNYVAHTLELRRIHSVPRTEETCTRMEALSLVKYIGAIGIIGDKVYALFLLSLCLTKFWYIGLGIFALSFIKMPIMNRLPKAWLFVAYIVNAVISISALAFVAWNR